MMTDQETAFICRECHREIHESESVWCRGCAARSGCWSIVTVMHSSLIVFGPYDTVSEAYERQRGLGGSVIKMIYRPQKENKDES